MQLSPDGASVAFLKPQDGVVNLWVAPRGEPGAARSVTQDRGRGIHRYLWADDNRTLLYYQDQGGDENHQLFAVDVQTGALRDLTRNRAAQTQVLRTSARHPGRVLAAINDRDPRHHDVYLIELATGARQRVLDGTGLSGFMADEDLQVRTAQRAEADGSASYFAVEKNGRLRSLFKRSKTDAFGTRALRLKADGASLYMLDNKGLDKTALVEVDLRSGVTRHRARGHQADIGRALFDPRSGALLATSEEFLVHQWTAHGQAVAADLAALQQRLQAPFDITSQSLDNQFWVVLAEPGDRPARYLLWDRQAQALTPLFDSRPELAGAQLAATRPVLLKSRDRLPLTSYLTLPVGAEGRPVPLVLVVHGGPWWRDSLGFIAEHQWLANRGFAALSVNFRGSTGLGKAFTSAGDHEWGRRMHEDLIDAVQWAVREGVTTADRVAISGMSYGGYSTLVGLSFTPTTFACGIDMVGPVNLVTLLEAIPPTWSAFKAQIYARVGDPTTEAGRKLLTERSPLTHVGRIQRPLLVGQGANDPRVNQSESDRLVAAMQARKIPVTYAVYGDEGHVFMRPESRLSFYAMAESFLGQCLGGRVQTVSAEDLKGAQLTVPEGAQHIPGLAEALLKR